MEYMLTYHDIHHPDSTYLIEKTTQYVMNKVRDDNNILANDLQATLTIKDYNQNATSRLDVDLSITDLEDTNRLPTNKRKPIYALYALYALEITTMETIFALLLAAIIYILLALINNFMQK
ncbi:hypothetical protein Bca4012_061313 [Brassica carinata]